MLTRTDVVALLERHGLEPSRALGQNFVVDGNTVERIARLAGVGPGDRVVEVGAGLGSLTLALLATGASVTAVEVDRRLVPVLREVVEPEGARVVEADATTADWDRVLGDGDEVGGGAGAGPWTLVANLPYNVATAIVLDVLDRAPQVHELLVMVQKEVGERMAAGPGTKAYGIPSLRVAYWADAEVVGTVPRTVFHPKPKVDSALVRIRRLPAPAVDADADAIFRLVRKGFGQRRKMLRRALADVVAPETFTAADVDPEARAEQLELPAWARLADAVAVQGPLTSGQTAAGESGAEGSRAGESGAGEQA